MNDFESESNVLAGMLKYEKCLYEGLSLLTPEHFYDPDYGIVFTTIITQSEKTKPTFSTVYKELREGVIGDKVRSLKTIGIGESSFGFWIKKVNDLFIKRSYYQAARDIATICKGEGTIRQIQELVEERIFRVNVREGADQILTPEEAGDMALNTFEERLKSTEKVHGIKLSRDIGKPGAPFIDGFPSIDKALMGLNGGDLIMICAETGEGKTTIAQNIVRHASIHQANKTYYQNTEMNPKEMVFRFAAQISGVEFGKIYSGDTDETETKRVRDAIETFKRANVFTSELPMLTPERSRGLAREFKMKYGQLDLLVIDYVGRMELENAKGKQEWQILKEIAKQSKRLGQELGTCVILIAQLNEDGKIQGAKAMANEADAVFFLEKREGEELNGAPYGATHELIPYKVRRGAKEQIWLTFNKPKMYISEVR